MDELSCLREEFKKFQSVPPRFRRYPKPLWEKVIKLSSTHSHQALASALGIGLNNIRRRLEVKKIKAIPGLAQQKIKMVELDSGKQAEKNISGCFEIIFPNGLQIKFHS